MSEILIKNMKLPDKATTIVVFPEGKARVFRQDIDHDEWLTAIEVPPHGDLISREWLIDIALHLLNTAKNDDIANGVKWLWQYIIDAPAIIPAELPKEEKEDKELLVEKIRKLQTYKLAPELEKLVSLEKVIAILEGEENVF